jgi:hypothetical protein
MASNGRCRLNYDLLQKETIYSRLPEFAARRDKPVEFCPANEAALLQIQATSQARCQTGLAFGIHPCSTTSNLVSPPTGFRVKDRPIFTTLRPCVAFW